ncbi:MAG: hypothetical protein RLZZ283_589 [Candidatus Parcubacteria bacterium]|jgi:hypothetical protein
MCWSLEASAGLAIVGAAATIYSYRRGDSSLLWVPLAYFVGMEVLQALSYPVINNCTSTQNQLLTLLSYFHIAFQPFFFNALYMYFIPKGVRQRILPWVYAFCFAMAVIMLVRVYPIDGIAQCQVGSYLCGSELCTLTGSWHLAWSVPLNDALPYVPAYALAVFILPLLYGSWKGVIFSVVTGPILSFLTTSNVNEQPAVWCLFSVAFLFLIFFTRLRDYLHVRSFFWWPKSWTRDL